MKCLLLVIGLALAPLPLAAQEKPVLVVKTFTAAAGVEVPYDLKLLQTQLVPELRVMLGKDFEVVSEAPAGSARPTFRLDAEITGWRAGNAAKRMLVGLGSGRESTDLQYRVTDGSGKQVLDKKDTIRTGFYNQGQGSSGTLGHPIAQKIADRIKEAKLK